MNNKLINLAYYLNQNGFKKEAIAVKSLIPLFVYGTLRKGEKNHHRLEGSEFLKKERLFGFNRSEGIGPAIIPGSEGDFVDGELYQVDSEVLEKIDEYEGEEYKRELVELSDGFEANVYVYRPKGGKPKAFIVPHASEEYSGHIAIEALKKISDYDYSSIVILGFDHDSNDAGIYSGSKYLPDSELINKLKESGLEEVPGDHSIGHLIPLVERFSDLPICPIVVNDNQDIVNIIKKNINDNILVIASTDLSHYNDAESAGEIDRQTISSIINKNGKVDMCGFDAINVLSKLFNDPIELIDYDNSAHLRGDKSRVVGYAAFQIGGFSEEILKAKSAIQSFIKNREWSEDDVDQKEIATFIGISKDGELQGSMGQTRPIGPYSTAAVKAFLNTLEDPRMQYNPEEVFEPGSGFAIKTRLLSDLQPTELEGVVIGKDGIVFEGGDKSAIFLPEVPTKQKWDHNAYLSELLQKGGLAEGEEYSLYKFQTEAVMIFS